ncbi:hypothetical protein BKA70DRAFT_1345484 [Coprinopsis sp. MPI-PUGE-AT-0042]|nr:hypothetical protein BKA70DRAFT_1345484 [Coprinopsis sp. MPI-PUGE-AT-0042]
MVATQSIILAVFCAVAQLSSAGTIPVARDHADLTLRTNAARMAAGLNPFTPRALERRTFGHHHPPSPPSPPAPPAPSPRPPTPPKPPVKRDGKLKCKKGGVVIGWVGDRNKKGFGLCNSRDSALSINFDDADDDLNIRLPNHNDFPFLGWVGNNLNSEMYVACAPRSTALSDVVVAPNRDAPSNVGNAFSSWAANSESNLWRKNNNRFSSRTESKTFYNPDDDLFHLVTDELELDN